MRIGRRIRRALDVAVFRLGQGPRAVFQAARESLFASPLYALTLKGRVPAGLSAPLADPWFDTAADADMLLAGYLQAGGRRIAFEGAPWAALPGDPAILADAHGFGWIGPLIERGGEEAHARALALTEAWLAANPRWSPTAWAADVLADRLVAWACRLAAVDGEADGFRDRLLKSFMMQARHLARTGGTGDPIDWRAFATCRGLIYCGLAIPGGEVFATLGRRRLEAEIDRQILPDGGHFQRCPAIHLRVQALLNDIRRALVAAHDEVPPSLQSAIDRMAPMLRLFRLGDGGLAVFNGGGEETRQRVDQVLGDSGSKGQGLINAPHTGFQRLAAGPTVIVTDTGTPPPPGAQARAQAGTLAFEMSVGPHRVVVNCGAPIGADKDWRVAMRATAAHSTVGIDDTNAVEFLQGGRIGSAPTEVESQRRESDGAVWLDAAHNGYVPLMGMTHKRRFYLSASGEDVRGEDVLSGDGGHTFRIRFHLHPSVQASLIQGGTGVLLRLPGGTGWRFRATGGTVSLEDSIYLGAGAPRRSEQIVVSGLLDAAETSLKWRFARVGG